MQSIVLDLLSTHAVAPTDGEWLEGLLVLSVEALVISGVGSRQEPFGMENSRLHPMLRVILDVLQVDADDVLNANQRVTSSF